MTTTCEEATTIAEPGLLAWVLNGFKWLGFALLAYVALAGLSIAVLAGEFAPDMLQKAAEIILLPVLFVACYFGLIHFGC